MVQIEKLFFLSIIVFLIRVQNFHFQPGGYFFETFFFFAFFHTETFVPIDFDDPPPAKKKKKLLGSPGGANFDPCKPSCMLCIAHWLIFAISFFFLSFFLSSPSMDMLIVNYSPRLNFCVSWFAWHLIPSIIVFFTNEFI